MQLLEIAYCGILSVGYKPVKVNKAGMVRKLGFLSNTASEFFHLIIYITVWFANFQFNWIRSHVYALK